MEIFLFLYFNDVIGKRIMEQFIVSARKYRPDSFESLIGQETIAATLKNSIRRNQLAHAYLFCGPRGVGKTTTARIFAKSINCLNPSGDMDPCGECESCISFQENRSYCIHELDAASNNSVDDIRTLTDMVRIPPQVGKYSVFIIDEVHMLSSAAFNAFLKTLEEPPSYAIFILATTEKHKVLPTVMSRCQTYDFNRISVGDIVKNLKSIAVKEGVTADDETYHILAMKADGAMRDALTLFDQSVAFCGKEIKVEDVKRNLNVLDSDYCFRIVENSLKGDYVSSLLILDEILSKGFNALHFISGLSSHLRNLLVCAGGGTDSLLDMPESLIEKYRSQASACPVPFLYESLTATTSCEAGYRQSGNQRLLIEFALMKMSLGTKAVHRPAPEALPQPAPQPASQPLSESAPQPEIQPLSQQPPRKQTSSPGVSLQGMMKKVVREETLPAEGTLPDNPYTEDDFLKAWSQLAEQKRAAGQQSLAAAMEMYHPLVDVANNNATFYLSNERQLSWMQAGPRKKMCDALRKMLNNHSLELSAEIAPGLENESQEKVPYTDSEKTAWLLKNNENFRELHKALELDVK